MAVLTAFSSLKGTLVHPSVEEVPCDRRGYKSYRCRCCGEQWLQTISSPQIVSQEVSDNFNKYYKDIIYCNR